MIQLKVILCLSVKRSCNETRLVRVFHSVYWIVYKLKLASWLIYSQP